MRRDQHLKAQQDRQRYRDRQEKPFLVHQCPIFRSTPFPSKWGTGSTPPSCQGLQRKIRFAAIAEPRTAPWICSASTAYSLQLGQKRQCEPINGRIVH